jgi:hypothetical protein
MRRVTTTIANTTRSSCRIKQKPGDIVAGLLLLQTGSAIRTSYLQATLYGLLP